MALPRDWDKRIDNWIAALGSRMVKKTQPLAVRFATTMDQLKPEQARKLPFKPAAPGMKWGKQWEYAWFAATAKLPAAPKNRSIVLISQLGDENNESVLTVNGEYVTGIDCWHNNVELAGLAKGGKPLEILLEAYAGHYVPGVYHAFVKPGTELLPPPPPSRQVFGGLWLGEWNEAAFQLHMDVQTLRKLSKVVDPQSLRKHKLDNALRDLSLWMDLEASEEVFDADIPKARKFLAPLLAARNGSTAPEFHLIGNSHIDVAWLWPLQQTYRKMGHTSASMLKLMERYKEFRFLQSQAQLYAYLKRDYPDVYRRVKAAAKRGQWVPEGSMWIEADMNVSGGEALIRQFLLGKRFFKQEFGIDQEVCWLPDVFGYNANLPQILAGCGVKYFTTQKIFWNYHGGTVHPYETFMWEGIDGTSILTHLHRTYTNHTQPENLDGRWKDNVHKEWTEKILYPFGWGDGGGGPDREQLEFLRREKDLEGLPRTRWSSPQEFFEHLVADGLPKDRWAGELYLEVHRGTFTSQAKTKRGNRLSELCMREAEMWSALAWASLGKAYPAKQLEADWKKLLLNQFHDILPGSSITRVYQEAEALHEQVIESVTTQASAARKALGGNKNGYVVWNSLSWERDAIVELPDEGCPVDVEGTALPVQEIGKGKDRRLLVAVPELPSCGGTTIRFKPGKPGQINPAGRVSASQTKAGVVMENDQLRLRLNGRGEVVECLDKQAERQLVPAGKVMNAVQLFRDNPANWDAWDIDVSYNDGPVALGEAESVRIVASGPLEARVRVVRKLSDASGYEQDIVLRAFSRRVDFVTTVDWQECHRLLKVAFPADLSSTTLRGEIQFGHVIRPTNRNMEFERQRFEWPAQKWAALSEAAYGIGLLNDCKYGYDFLDGALRLTLLRAPVAPDPLADRGRQEFTYSLALHEGPFTQSRIVQEAYELNVPARVEKGCLSGGRMSFALVSENMDLPSDASVEERELLQVFDSSAMIETIKRSEDGKALIVRLYETMGGSADVKLWVATPFATAQECDMLENPTAKLKVAKDRSVPLRFRPFEVKTIRLE